MTVAAIIDKFTGEIVTACQEMGVTEAIGLLAGRKIGALPVVDDKGGVVGIMSERDIIYCLQRDGAAVLDWPVGKIMTAPAITVRRDMTVMAALSLMTKRRIRHLPVEENGRLVGIVSIGDLVKYRMDKIEEEAAQMLEYIQAV